MDDQKKMKNARAKGWYDEIWKNISKCVFCDLKEKYILYEENEIVLTVNLYPYIDGHLMAIPRRHIRSPKELTEKQWNTIRKMNYIAKKLIRKVHNIKGMWTLIREGGEDAQMTVIDHLHVHFIPFDDKQLCEWNFRALKYTPLENVALYKKEPGLIEKLAKRFENKYISSL